MDERRNGSSKPNGHSVVDVEARFKVSDVIIECERCAPKWSGRIGYRDSCKVSGKFWNSSDTMLTVTVGGLSLSQGDMTDSVASYLRTCLQINAVERSAESVARYAGHEVTSKFASLKGHAWPQ
jgi:hypothetical protein